jgi:plasmid maintenance system antidote protein VapI
VTFRQFLAADFAARQTRNRRYSLRGYARAMGVDHSTLSQLLRGCRTITSSTIRRLGERARLDAMAIETFVALQDDVRIVELVTSGEVRPDSRAIAVAIGRSVDEVNIALQRLLRCGLLRMTNRNRWEGGPRWATR